MLNIETHLYLLNENFTYDETELNKNKIYVYSKIIEIGNNLQQIIISLKNKTEVDIIFNCHCIKSINNINHILYSYKTLLIKNNVIMNIDPFNYNIFSDDYSANINSSEIFINEFYQHQLIIDKLEEYFYQNIFNKIIYENRIKRHLDDCDYDDESFESKRKYI